MLKHFLISILISNSIFLPITHISAADNNNVSTLVSKILTKELSDTGIICLKEIKAPAEYQQYLPEFEKQLLQALIKNGYTVTKNKRVQASFRLYVEIEHIEINNVTKLFEIFLLLKLENLGAKKFVIATKATVTLQQQDSNWIKFRPLGDLNYLAGGELETQDIRFTKVYANRTASWNDRDLQAGIQVQFPKRNINSVISLRTRSSFGRDDLKFYKAYFEATSPKTSFLCGIFPLQFGIQSRYLNSTVQRPYWNTGLIFDSDVCGFSASLNCKSNKFSFYWATNRNPSMVIAAKWNFTSYKKAHQKSLDCSLSAIYIARDDVFNDVGKILGFEIKYQHNKKLFLYGLTAMKYFVSGSMGHLEGKIFPFFVEYQYSLTPKWIIKGAYLSVNQWINKRGRSLEESIYQEIDFKANKQWTSGLQYERFYIGDFWENNYTAVFYFSPCDFNSCEINKISAIFKFRYVNSQFGGNLFFFAVEGRVRF